jgi:hypothetical protein
MLDGARVTKLHGNLEGASLERANHQRGDADRRAVRCGVDSEAVRRQLRIQDPPENDYRTKTQPRTSDLPFLR